jgi:hypothetical protein
MQADTMDRMFPGHDGSDTPNAGRYAGMTQAIGATNFEACPEYYWYGLMPVITV